MTEIVCDPREFLFVEKYRPKTVDECILPERIKKTFREYVIRGELTNFLFHGTAGVGKTTIAKALCNDIGAEYIYINASESGNIDTLRVEIRAFASTISLTDAKKVVILDEADHLNANSTQPALRGFMEEFSSNCRFIFTCNHKNRIIEPLHSRCSVIDFKINSDEKKEMSMLFCKRAIQILTQENIEFDKKVVAELVNKHFPDYRRILMELQRYSVSGKIDSGIFIDIGQESYRELIKSMKDKNFTSVRNWVAKNTNISSDSLMRELYDNAFVNLEQSSVPQLSLILAEYAYKSAFVADQEINIMACLTEIMSSCKFK